MSFKQKNIVVTLVNFSLILGFYLFRLWQLLQNGNFSPASVFRLWGIVIVLAVVVTVAATILTHIVAAVMGALTTGTRDAFRDFKTVPAFFGAVKTGDDDALNKIEITLEDFEDERDKLIDLKGTNLAYSVSSIGGFFAMLSFALGQPPLVMFALLVFFGITAQIVGDVKRLVLYYRGV